jgi:hypothetical protein
MCGAFYVFHRQNVITLLLRVAGNIVEGFALGQEYFKDVTLVEF